MKKNVVEEMMREVWTFSWWVAFALAVGGANVVFARHGGPTHLRPPLRGITGIEMFLEWLLGIIMIILTPVVVLMIVYTGFSFIAAHGNPEKINDARKMLLWTSVGAGIILGAQVIRTVVFGTVDQIG